MGKQIKALTKPPTKPVHTCDTPNIKEDSSVSQRMMTHLKGVQKHQTKDSRDSNVEPELHVGLPMCYSYSYEAQIPSKVER